MMGSFFFQAEDGIRDLTVTGVQTCALPISYRPPGRGDREARRRGRQAARRAGAAHGQGGRDQRRGDQASRARRPAGRSEEHTSELQSQSNLVCRLLLEKKKNTPTDTPGSVIGSG